MFDMYSNLTQTRHRIYEVDSFKAENLVFRHQCCGSDQLMFNRK